MTVPNILTASRLALAILSLCLLGLHQPLFAAAGMTVAVLLDALDGIAARRLQQVTVAGVFFDIVTDKIVIIATFLLIGFLWLTAFFWLGLLMLLREYLTDGVRLLASATQTVLKADRWSKVKGILFMTAMLAVLWNHATLQRADIDALATGLAVIGMIVAYAGFVRLLFRHRSFLRTAMRRSRLNEED